MEAICIDFGNTICKAACFTDGELNVVNFFTHQNALTELEKMIAEFGAIIGGKIVKSPICTDSTSLFLANN